MKIFQKIKNWVDYKDIEGVMEYKKYRLTVTLDDGGILELESSRYHAIICSYSEYITIGKDRGLRLLGKFYPWHMIKHIEDEVIDTQLVCVNSIAYGIGGLDREEIEQNQEKYQRVIDKYKRLHNEM